MKKNRKYDGIDGVNSETRVPKIITYVCLSLSLVTTVSYFIYTVITSQNIVDQASTIISISIMAVFAIFFVITSLFADNKRGRTFVIIAALLLTSFSGFNLLVSSDILRLPTQNYMLDFTGKQLTEVVSFAKENEIKLEQIYENSESVSEYGIINQSVTPGTLLKKVDKMMVTISSGPSTEKEVVIPNMLGWQVDQVIEFIDDNHLSNVSIDFVKADDVEADTIIEQSMSGNMRRNAELRFVASLGDITSVKIVDLSNLDIFHAITWIKRNNLKYEITYEYSDKVDKGFVISQSIKKGEVVSTSDTVIKIVVSKGAKIKVPNLVDMSVEEVTNWVVENSLKIVFEEAYDENIEVGKIISSNFIEGNEIEQGTLVKIVISKGVLKMEEFSSFNDFKTWADNNGLTYNAEYQFDDNVKSGNIIKTSHNKGDVIKNNDTITVYVSQGASVKIPNFVGSNKSTISNKCSSVGLKCNFVYGGYNNSVAKDVATSQSKRSGSVVGRGTSVTITLSSGKPGTCTARIQETWFEFGNASKSIATIKSKLSSQCPGVNFNVIGKSDNSAPVGMLHPNSPIKGEPQTFVQGQTYTIWIVQ